VSDFVTLIDQTARSMSTPILRRVRDDTVALLEFVRARNDYAVASFCDVAINHMNAEIDRRDKARETAA
jgi:hypothetical protein